MRSAQLPAPGSGRFLGQLNRSGSSSVRTVGRCQLSGLRARFPAGSRRMRSQRLLRRVSLVRGFVRAQLG